MVGKIISKLCSSVFSNNKFRKDFEHLATNELRPGNSKSPLSTIQVKKLAESSAILSLSDNDNHRKLAFKIAIFLFKQFGKELKSIPFVVELVLSRLGDLPTIKHMYTEDDGFDYFSYFRDDQDFDSSSFKFPETAAKKIINQLDVGGKEPWNLTDFQTQVFHKLIDGKNVAYAAPTSAGKSFVIHNYTVFKILNSEKFTAVYILPTKTLIAEVQKSIRTKLRNFSINQKDVMVVSSANDINVEQLKQIPKKVLVLTQERLQNILSEGYNFDIDLLVIDEAQKVQDDERGVILEDVVNEVSRTNSKMQVVLISPYVGNLKKFKEIFNITEEVETISSSKTPVGRNVFHVNFKDKNFVTVSLYSEEFKQKMELEKFPIPTNTKIPTTQYGTKAWMASHLLKGAGHTLVYCTRPVECKKIAGQIGSNLGESKISEKLQETIDFMKNNVHEQYDLVDALKSRIGYHYGKMPHFVRLTVQEIFEEKEIDYLCCTSTLLEGVNLPARNIILYKPQRGVGKPMDKYTVRNLAGRVGRLGKDYYGNIYCIDIDEWDEGSDAFDEELEDIESSIEHTLSIDVELLINHLREYSEIEQGKRNVRAVATSLIVKQIKNPEKDFLSKLQEKYPTITDENKDRVHELLVIISQEIHELNKNIILKNSSIDPRLQYKLYKFLKQSPKPPVLPYPGPDKIYNELLEVFDLVYRFLLTQDQKKHSVQLCTYIATEWINQYTYKGILENMLSFESDRRHYELSKKEINEIIDRLDEILEQDLKFGYARGLRCYSDIINSVIEERNLDLDSCSELPEHLEAGAHTKEVYLLMNVGLSRNNAITISKMMKSGVKITTLPECMEFLHRNKEKIKTKFKDKVMLREFEYLLEE